MREKSFLNARRKPALQNDGADGTRRALVFQRHETASCLLLECHMRNDGDAQARVHHPENAREVAALKNNLRIQVCAFAGLTRCPAEAMAVAQKQERFFPEFRER